MKRIFEKEITFQPAFDRKTEGYGIGTVQIRFLLKTTDGAVQFLMGTDWCVPSVDVSTFHESTRGPRAWDIGYHSPKPMFEDQSDMGECPCLDGRRCYYDGSALNAEPILVRLIAEGESAVWEELEKYYYATFAEKEKA